MVLSGGGNDIKSSTTESIGFIATHELSWYQKSSRINEIDVNVSTTIPSRYANGCNRFFD